MFEIFENSITHRAAPVHGERGKKEELSLVGSAPPDVCKMLRVGSQRPQTGAGRRRW